MTSVWRAQAPEFATGLEGFGEATALITEAGDEISYRQLAERADAFASGLATDVRLLAISISNSLEPVVAYLAALRSGCPVMLLSGAASRQAILANCPPDAIYELTAEGWRLSTAALNWRTPPHPDLALMLSTSGSTGSAKLVRLSRAALQANAASIASYLGIQSDDRAITSLPLSYSYGLSVLNSHLAAGASVVLTDRGVSDPEFGPLMELYDVTGLAGVPYSYELIDRAGLLDALPSRVRTLTQAGGRMAPEMIRRVADAAQAQGARLFVMYGQTEATARIAYLPPEMLMEHIGAIGGPIPGGELWVERDGVRADAGEEGELVYRGANVMMGYAENRDDLAAPPGSDILRTGDIAVEAAPGIFRITGRKSRFVKPFGLRVSLDELERRFQRGGAAVVVTGDDQMVVACGPSAAEGPVRSAFAELALPPELLTYVALESPPVLPTGKPDYLTILRLGRERRQGAMARASGIGAVEIFFQRLARGAPVPATASFESLGGDSLSYVQCSLLIEDALGELPEGWASLSLAELRAQAAEAKRPAGRARWRVLESDIVVRAGAILLILANHAFGGLSGGADVLMMLAGYSWSRFQRPRLIQGAHLQVVRNFAERYLLFYVLMIVGVSGLNKRLALSHLTFTSTFKGDWGGILNTYWFIESLTWCVVLVCAASAIPSVRRFIARRPFDSGLAFVALALIVRLGGLMLTHPHATAFRSPDQMLAYFAAGWAIAVTDRKARALLFAVLLVLSELAWSLRDTHIYVLAIAAITMVVFRRVALPAPAAAAISLVAAASFYIYLLNPLPMYVTDQLLHAKYGRYGPLQIAATLVAGIAMYLALELWARRHTLRSTPAPGLSPA